MFSGALSLKKQLVVSKKGSPKNNKNKKRVNIKNLPSLRRLEDHFWRSSLVWRSSMCGGASLLAEQLSLAEQHVWRSITFGGALWLAEQNFS